MGVIFLSFCPCVCVCVGGGGGGGGGNGPALLTLQTLQCIFFAPNHQKGSLPCGGSGNDAVTLSTGLFPQCEEWRVVPFG